MYGLLSCPHLTQHGPPGAQFIDATKKGAIARFANHSCDPNCYVDKWIVGDKLRIGIFALRPVRAGEELVFNYNVDRYGADPQPCYCGEPNCAGFIGGKTQTERATKLPVAVLEALGIDEAGLDGMDRKVLETILHKFDGGPVGIDNLSTAIGEERDVIEDVFEPFLIQQGFLQRTRQGRVITRHGMKHLGFVPPPSGPGEQEPMF